MTRVGLALGASWLGGVSYCRNLLEAILALPDRRIEPVLLVGRRADNGILAALPPVEVIRTGLLDRLTPRWGARKVWQQVFGRDPLMGRFLRSHGIDVLSHSDFLGTGAAPPAICWIPDLQHRQLPQFSRASQRWYRDHNISLQCRHATRIILSSHDAERELARFQPSCVGKARVLQFVAQPRVSAATPDLETLRERYGIGNAYFHVPNQFWAHKNHRLILDALAVLKARGDPVLVVSTGPTTDYRDPQHFARLMAHADAIGVQSCFRALGVIPYGDLVGLMVNAVAVINPSRAEGWSTSVEEAKSLGKQVILSDLPVHREQAPPGGIYFGVDDASGLAEAMQVLWTTYDVDADGERRTRAQRDLPARVEAFGRAYQDIVLELADV